MGLIIDMSGAGLSYYPIFQDFNENDYVIPFQKNDDFPNFRDLLIMNVYSDCQMSDSVFSQFSMNDDLMCTTAQNWIISLLIVIFIGIVMMFVGAIYPFKIKNTKHVNRN